MGIYQREQTRFNRPPLGFEAAANLIGGVNTDSTSSPVGSPGSSTVTTRPARPHPSLLDVNAEFALPSRTQTARGRPISRSSKARPASSYPLGKPPGNWEPAAISRGLEASGLRRVSTR